MRKISVFVTVIALVMTSTFIQSFGQTQETKPTQETMPAQMAETKLNMVSLDVLRFLGFYNLSYTRALTPAISVTAQLETPTNFLLGSVLQESGFGARIEGRYNFAQRNLVGIYAGPVIGYNTSTFRSPLAASVTDFSATVNWVALGAMVGYQFALIPSVPEFMTGFGIGAEYAIISASATGTGVPATVPTSGNSNGVYPRFRATIGYAF